MARSTFANNNTPLPLLYFHIQCVHILVHSEFGVVSTEACDPEHAETLHWKHVCRNKLCFLFFLGSHPHFVSRVSYEGYTDIPVVLGSSQWMLALLIQKLYFPAWRFNCAIMNSRWRILITVMPPSKSVLGMVSFGMCHLHLNLIWRCLMWPHQSKYSSVL